MIRSLVQTGLFLLVVLLALKLLVWLLEARMAFYPMRGEQMTPADHGVLFEPLWLETDDGESIHGWLMQHPSARAVVVYWHGNGGNLSVWLDQLLTLYHHRLSIVAIDYRGYGLSSGRPSERGVYRDTDALIRWARDWRGRADRPLVYWGRSLGGPIAAYATTRLAPDGLILESTFADVQSLLRSHPVMWILGLLATYRFPTLEYLRGYDRPVLVMHGDRDEVIPYRLGARLHAGLGRTEPMVTIDGGRHNDLHAASEASYWAPVDTFIEGLELG